MYLKFEEKAYLTFMWQYKRNDNDFKS